MLLFFYSSNIRHPREQNRRSFIKKKVFKKDLILHEIIFKENLKLFNRTIKKNVKKSLLNFKETSFKQMSYFIALNTKTTHKIS